MDKLTINDVFRYVTIGYVIFAVLYYCDRAWAAEIYTVLGTVGFTAAALVIGSLFYLVYRPLLYNLILFFIVDRLYHSSIRRTLMDRYTIASHFEADAVWKLLQHDPRIKERLPPIHLASSGIHLLYMTAIASLLGAIYITLRTGFTTPVWVMLLVSLTTAAAAVTDDIYTEKKIKHLFNMIDTQVVVNVIADAGYRKRSA